MHENQGLLSSAAQARAELPAAADASEAASAPTEPPVSAVVRSISPEPVAPARGAGVEGSAGAPASKAVKVADIQCGKPDARGAEVKAIYAMKDEVYAIYRAEKIMVHFADAREVADEQRRAIAHLAALRARLELLTSQLKCAEYYNLQMASAFQLALDGEKDCALAVMTQAVGNAQKERESRGRVQYLLWGFVSGFVFFWIFAGGHWLTAAGMSGNLWLAAIGGTVGALFSLSMSIRSRTVALDVDRWTNVTDGILRVVIGVIAGAALTLLLATGILPELKVQEVAITGPQASWEAIVLVGFIAGFLERLLPDLLEGRQAVTGAAANAAAGAG
jgi:hypothetical protein